MALLAPQDLPAWVPGKILANSDGLDWKGVAFRTYDYHGQDVEIPAMRDFMLVAYLNGVTPMQRRFEGRWSRTTCAPGNVSLLTRSQPSHWHWDADIAVSHLYLTADFVSSVAREFTGRSVADVTLADKLRVDDPILSLGVQAIAQEATQRGAGGRLYVDAVARQIVIHLLRQYCDISLSRPSAVSALSAAELRRIEDYVDAHLDHNIGLEDLSAQVTMGVTTFARCFKSSTGVAPYEYVMQRRIDRARDLLEHSHDAIKQIAVNCGFSDQAHLTRAFKKQIGAPPAQFRQQVQTRQP